MNDVTTLIEEAQKRGLEPHPQAVLIINFYGESQWELNSLGTVLRTVPSYITGEENYVGMKVDLKNLRNATCISAYSAEGNLILLSNKIIIQITLDSGEIIS